MRLYCLRVSDKILIFGNGGIKDGKIILVDKDLIGNLNFTRYENE